MWDVFSYKFELWKLQRQKEKDRKLYKRAIDNARKEEKSGEEIDCLIGESMDSRDYTNDEIADLQSRIIVRQAEKYLIPTPKYITEDGIWEKSKITGRWRLSQNTISNLKEAIRQEQKYKREYWQSYITLFIGLLGALIGLVSVWM